MSLFNMPLFSWVKIDFPFLQSFENENFVSWLATITETPACVPKCNQIIIAKRASQYIYSDTHYLREEINWKKKNIFFRALPELPRPLPQWPQFGQLGPLFSEIEIQDLKVSLELRILYVLYNILYICNLKNS